MQPPYRASLRLSTVAAAGVALLVFRVPAWAALLLGAAISLVFAEPPFPWLKTWTTRALQAGVVALGAGVPLAEVLRVGGESFVTTLIGLCIAFAVAFALGRLFGVPRDTTLLLGAGTAICGGSAIAAVASVTQPKAEELSIALAIVFLLNGVGLVVFPPLGHALGMSQVEFGRWAALAIHDTSSVVGAAVTYGDEALAVATTMKLVRALWIVPLTIVIALVRRREAKGIKWPWFILGFVAMAWLMGTRHGPERELIVWAGKRLLVIALFLTGLSLSRQTLRSASLRPFALGVTLWIVLATASLFTAGGK